MITQTTQTQTPAIPQSMDDADREYWLSKRQALLIELRAVERRLGMPPSVPPRREPKARG